MLNINNISYQYNTSEPVLADISFSVSKGEIVALLGPSGCGKSTLLRLISGLLKMQSGDIRYTENTAPAFVFQEASLMPWATVYENVALPLNLKKEKCKQSVNDCIKSVGLQNFENKRPSELSGGQKMRVSIARALASNSELLLLDEPFAALDEILRFQMNNLLLSLCEEKQITSIFVTHSIYEAAYLADKIFIMNNGKISGMVEPHIDRTLTPDEQRTSANFMNAAKSVAELLAGEKE